MSLYDDEPTFTLRARDPLAPILVELWVEMRKFSRPLHKEGDNKLEIDRRTEALGCAADMNDTASIELNRSLRYRSTPPRCSSSLLIEATSWLRDRVRCVALVAASSEALVVPGGWQIEGLPATVRRAGPQAAERTVEFFTAQIRNPHTRAAVVPRLDAPPYRPPQPT